mmetsp:Transcript_29129/g.89051  ORF Transcript_29129/g.89051 Transcript_29129/m.89051 type:complete len:255 (-) Transcript_29129:484-1248(-)
MDAGRALHQRPRRVRPRLHEAQFEHRLRGRGRAALDAAGFLGGDVLALARRVHVHGRPGRGRLVHGPSVTHEGAILWHGRLGASRHGLLLPVLRRTEEPALRPLRRPGLPAVAGGDPPLRQRWQEVRRGQRGLGLLRERPLVGRVQQSFVDGHHDAPHAPSHALQAARRRRVLGNDPGVRAGHRRRPDGSRRRRRDAQDDLGPLRPRRGRPDRRVAKADDRRPPVAGLDARRSRRELRRRRGPRRLLQVRAFVV